MKQYLSFRTAFRILMFALALPFSQSISAEKYEFQFADFISSWYKEDAMRGTHKVILSDAEGSNEFKLTIQTTYEGAETSETTYYGLKPTGYCDKPDIQFIKFENDDAYYNFINKWNNDNTGSKEFLYISKDNRLPLSVHYTNDVFYKENPSAANSLQSAFSVTYRRLLDNILKNRNIQKETSKVQKDNKTASVLPKSSSASTQKSDFDYDAWCVSTLLENPMRFRDYPQNPDGFYSFAKEKYESMYMNLSGSSTFRMSLKNVDMMFGKGCWFTYYFYRDKERWNYSISFDNVSQAKDFVTKTLIPRLAKQDIKFSPVKNIGSHITARYEAVYSGNDITVDIIGYDSDANVDIEVTRELTDLDPALPSLVRPMSIKELLSHPFGLENSTLDSSFDSIITELRNNRYAIAETSYSGSKKRVLETPPFGLDPRSAPVVQFPLKVGNTLVNLSSDKYILAHNGARYTYNIAIPVDLPGGTYDQSKKYREEVFRSLVECLKREGYQMKNASKGLWFHFDDNASNIKKAFIGQKGDKTVSVGLGIYNDIYLSVENPHKE